MKCETCIDCGASEGADFGLCARCMDDLNAFIAPYAAIHHALKARDEVIAAGFRKVVIDRWKALRALQAAS